MLGTIEECRVKIKDFFYSGIGVELQNKDAKIAERIMLEMLDNQCIALTMHDSFIVNGYEEDKLRDCMESAFLDVVGVKCEISKKWTLDQWENRYPKSYDRFFENGGFDTFYGNYYSWLVDQGLRGAYKKGQFF